MRARRPGRTRPAASSTREPTAMLGAGFPELTLHGQLDLVLGPGHGPLGGHAVDRLGDHVGQDVVDLDELDRRVRFRRPAALVRRSEEHTSELQSHSDLVCRLLLEKKKKKRKKMIHMT